MSYASTERGELSMIRVRNVTLRYANSDRFALKELSADIPVDRVVAIVGASGSGKSTLLRILAGAYRRHDPGYRFDGEVRLRGVAPESDVGPCWTALMPQSPCLLDHLTCRGNIRLPWELIVTAQQPELEAAYDAVVGELGLEPDDRWPAELSEGMKTRVALARALIPKPRYLFLDEPFSAIDLGRRWIMYKALLKMRTPEMSVVLTTHDLWEACFLASTILVLKRSGDRDALPSVSNDPPDLERSSKEECIRQALPSVLKLIPYTSAEPD